MVPVEEYNKIVSELSDLCGLTPTEDTTISECVSALTNCLTGKRLCSVDGCESRAYAHHVYCTKHRLRFERTGDPLLARKRGRKAR